MSHNVQNCDSHMKNSLREDGRLFWNKKRYTFRMSHPKPQFIQSTTVALAPCAAYESSWQIGVIYPPLPHRLCAAEAWASSHTDTAALLPHTIPLCPNHAHLRHFPNLSRVVRAKVNKLTATGQSTDISHHCPFLLCSCSLCMPQFS